MKSHYPPWADRYPPAKWLYYSRFGRLPQAAMDSGFCPFVRIFVVIEIYTGFGFQIDGNAEVFIVMNSNILDQVSAKGADIGALADQLIKNSESIPKLIDALKTEESSKKYAYEKVLRFVSAKQPALIYPYFDFFCSLLDHENNFLKWGAIMTVANLTAADTEKKFEAIFRKYFVPINGPTMITAANIIGSSVAIAGSKPALTGEITREILRVEKAKFLIKGSPSPECRNVAIGHAIDALDGLYDQIDNKAEVIRFVKRQLKSTRKQVVQRAEKFLRKHE
jgi:hypothetical protein